MSKLTDAQLRAALESSEATARKHEAAGNPRAAASAWARATRNREELRRREGLEQDPPQEEEAPPAAVPSARPAPIPTPYPPDNAVRDAEKLIADWGTSATVRAVCVALNNHTSYAASMPLEDAPRVIAMQRRYAQ